MEIEIRKEEAGIRNCRPAEGEGERAAGGGQDSVGGMGSMSVERIAE